MKLEDWSKTIESVAYNFSKSYGDIINLEDLKQEAYLKFLELDKQGKITKDKKMFVCISVRNHLFDILRKNYKHHINLNYVEEFESINKQSNKLFENDFEEEWELNTNLRKHIQNTLTDEELRILDDFYFKDKSAEEIQKDLGIKTKRKRNPGNATNVKKWRALNKIRRTLP